MKTEFPLSSTGNRIDPSRIPPGQTIADKFPVLTYGDVPKVETSDWKLDVWGLIEEPVSFTWNEFMKLPQTSLKADFHCVTAWSRFDDMWEGVLFKDFAGSLKIKPPAKFVMQHAYGGYTTNLPLTVMLEEDVMFAHTLNGEPLPRDHGGPMRVITARRYAWKGAKWIRGVEFMSENRPGFWERNGYSNSADPWKEERYYQD
jgi:DMSO/TMAO reductase YedYZ molybdopterin-dependent catalytic subunit